MPTNNAPAAPPPQRDARQRCARYSTSLAMTEACRLLSAGPGLIGPQFPVMPALRERVQSADRFRSRVSPK